jgi:hypothetical protein
MEALPDFGELGAAVPAARDRLPLCVERLAKREKGGNVFLGRKWKVDMPNEILGVVWPVL